ncbi:cation:proton antiporter [Allorhizobium taibaishanense]|uniref:Cation transporter n=1 Tax=Allorhizobium taibaishanense TaxID=887144 RepID=A0A1Q8ZYG2_9HYPH|nr:cation:proton antiporter [Allorhizobium taibaishanense]MBB4008104.1 NhaP-type Na+/H+ or K+/H+ antiporter [Allorhizobium taibaishanense]OLP47110.1 cation transporter [Allorhizobium taibaishanense]
MNHYVVTLFIFGAVVLLTTWLPLFLKRMPLSLPICCIAIGIVVAWSPFTPLPQWNPIKNPIWAEHLTEFVVIVALMGAGLKIDRPLGLKSWTTTWRLLGIAMPLSIGAIAILGWGMLGLGSASALLLGAALAPTDPVLASDIQVGPPQTGEEDDIRFALTSEAGLNDGLSFPFVLAAVAMTKAGSAWDWVGNWLLFDVVWKLVAGIAMGWLAGRILGYFTFRVPETGRIAKTGDGLAALGFTCLSYGATELIHGYGFVAVFVTALTLRSVERESAFHHQLHDFGEQIERLLTMVVLVCFGAVIADGGLFAEADWRVIAVAVLVLAVVRPLAGWISLLGCRRPASEKLIVSVFGIRGLGSIYYLGFATGAASFTGMPTIWATVFIVILLSVVMHGITVTPVMRWIDRARGVDSMQPTRPAEETALKNDGLPG